MPAYIQPLRTRAKEGPMISFPEATSQSWGNGSLVIQGTNGQISIGTTAGNNIATGNFITGLASRPASATVNTRIPVVTADDQTVFVGSLCSNSTGTAYSTAYAFNPAASNYYALRNVSGNFVVNIAASATNQYAHILGPIPGTESDTVPLVAFKINPVSRGTGA